jgi:hypothetical protein
MNTTKYLLAKYIPDMHRFEPRNIGVIVWSPLGIEARFLAENAQRPGEVDGRSIPAFVTSDSAYKQWVRYWREALSSASIRPIGGSEIIPASSPAFFEALQKTSKGNFVIADAGNVLDEVRESDLAAVANQLYSQLVLETAPPEEAPDRSFEDRCDELLVKTRLKAHRHFHDRYPVKCTVRGVEEEYVFSHALANGKLELLFQRFPIPKRKGHIQKSRDAMAWTLESLINGKVVTPEQVVLIVDETPERQSETEVDKTLRLLGGMSHLVNIQNPLQAEAVFAEAAKLP